MPLPCCNGNAYTPSYAGRVSEIKILLVNVVEKDGFWLDKLRILCPNPI